MQGHLYPLPDPNTQGSFPGSSWASPRAHPQSFAQSPPSRCPHESGPAGPGCPSAPRLSPRAVPGTPSPSPQAVSGPPSPSLLTSSCRRVPRASRPLARAVTKVPSQPGLSLPSRVPLPRHISVVVSGGESAALCASRAAALPGPRPRSMVRPEAARAGAEAAPCR